MSRVKVGFIGAGGMANAVHYPSLADSQDLAELVAICDFDAEKLQSTADKYGVAARYSDYRAMLAEQALDAVYVIMPPMPLKDIVLDCIAAGKHVFVEKPLGMSAAEAQEMAAAASKRGVLSAVGFNRRFAPVVVEAKKMIDDRGATTSLLAEFHKFMLGQRPYYEMSIVLMDVIHAVDFMRFIAGEAVDIASSVQMRDADWKNVFSSLICFDSGAVGTLLSNRVSGTRYERFEVHGTGIAAYIRAPERAEVFADGAGEPTILEGAKLVGRDDFHATYGYLQETRHFLSCIRDGKQPATNFADALKTMQLCEAVEAGGWGKL
jgi:predicted dehydrogenase